MPSQPRSTTTTPITLALPDRIGERYHVLAGIGRGAIAEVVRARDETTGREVALKVLYPNLRAAPGVAERFRREVELVRRIAHPHVIRIHDLGETDGLVYLVMEYHPGGDLADRLARGGPLPGDALLVLGRQLCGALDAAHRAGIVHRDVKPQNVLVGQDAGLDVRLCDFGLARTADLAGLTSGTTVLGTPEYMAPEVIASGFADPRSDLYSLGVLLYEAATGQLPFSGDSPYQILRRQLEEPPPLGRLPASVGPSFRAALERVLAKEPLDRFPSAADFLAALEASAEPRALVAVSTHALAQGNTGQRCRSCGGQLLDAVGLCVDCGRGRLRLVERRRGGVAVLVTGPGEPADRIDGRSHAELVTLLDELPPGSVKLDALRKRAPRLPFYVADRLDPDAAAELLKRLGEIGLHGRVVPRASLSPPEVRKKVGRMGGRYLAVLGGSTAGVWNTFGRHAPFLLLGVLFFLTMPFLVTAFSYRRPLLRLRLPPLGLRDDHQRLLRALKRLTRREERRLVARVLDLLLVVGREGGAELEPALRLLGERSAQVAEGLVALETPNAAVDERTLSRRLAAATADESARIAQALDELRETERVRAQLVTDLLRAWSRLDSAATRIARARALEAALASEALREEAAELTTALEAEEEVARLLDPPSTRPQLQEDLP